MNAYLEILRPGNALMAVVAIFLVALINGTFNLNVFLAAVAVFMATGAGNAINDYFDHRIDAINKPQRPIPSGRISLKNAGRYSAALFIIAIAIGFYINILPGIIVLLSSLLMIWYAYNLKRKCLIGNLSISFLTGLCFVFGGVVVGHIYVSIALGFYAFLMTISREIVKDMEDVEGDREEGATTLPIVHGKKSASILAAFFIVFASITSPVLYFIGIFNALYLLVLAPAILVFLSCAVSILRDVSVENTAKISKRLKMGMGITFLAFAIGSPFVAGMLGF
ncbi:UbiA family prenyltransferase [Methanobacterium aggregans]|uniref:UbiA family prenyltransferase n=1 Tax=Methanobacterium aggregans TaxID=1615586 RepID=UPI001AEA41B7|nr:UbiA family prenyltransferase [Methanobacterium aggregans]MBP2046468.1 geranylgeranylglycerol-phosphate geranylgeranyltransferase [Methanobacterium aggregans]